MSFKKNMSNLKFRNMKSLKIFVIVGLSLLFGGTCFAQQQEEFQRDSVWGLEWNLQDSILTVSFMSSCDGFFSFQLMSFRNGVYNGYDFFERISIANLDGDIISTSTHLSQNMSFVSCAIDTISVALTRYTISVSLNSIYLTIPQDISTYCGYFGIIFQAENHRGIMYDPYEDLTKVPQFLYFNLLDTLTSSEEYRQEEEFQRDSVWGLEWNLQDSILTVSFMSSCDGFFSFQLMSFRNGVYNGYDFFERISIANLDGDIISTSTHLSQNMSFVSCAIDTISVALTRYTISVSLNSIYLTIPQDISTYCGYFGIIFQAENHRGIMYDPYEDLTKVPQFLYFNLLDTLTSSEEYRQEEEFQRDSVWGLEWNLQDSILTMSFMSSCDGFETVRIISYIGGVYNGMPGEFFEHCGLTVMPGGFTAYRTEIEDIIYSSLMVDTISANLTRYTLSVKLGSVYLTIPQDLSSYPGYFGVMLTSQDHSYWDVYWQYNDDFTKCNQFMYFNLLNSLTWNEDYRNDSTLYNEVYYSMAGIPLREMPENEPVIVVRKSADNQVVSSKVCMRRR